MRMTLATALLLGSCFCIAAQEPSASSIDRRVALNETAVALDASGAPALEATLKTTTLNGAEDSPVTNIRLVVKNSSSVSYAFVSGLVTFYDSASVRCGEGLFKADALSAGEAFETDTPGIRIRCAPATWRIVEPGCCAFTRDRCHGHLSDSAGHHVLERAQVILDIERDPVPRNPVARVHANGREFAMVAPDTGLARLTLCVDANGSERVNDDRFELTQVPMQVLSVLLEPAATRISRRATTSRASSPDSSFSSRARAGTGQRVARGKLRVHAFQYSLR